MSLYIYKHLRNNQGNNLHVTLHTFRFLPIKERVYRTQLANANRPAWFAVCKSVEERPQSKHRR